MGADHQVGANAPNELCIDKFVGRYNARVGYAAMGAGIV